MVKANSAQLVISLLFIKALYGSGYCSSSSSMGRHQAEAVGTTPAPMISDKLAVTNTTELQHLPNQCPVGCRRDPKSACSIYSVDGTGCVITGTSGNRALCCNNLNTLKFSLKLRAAGRCDKTVTAIAAQHMKKSMQDMHQSMIKAGSLMNIVSVTAICEKITGAFSVPASYKVKTKLKLIVNIAYRGSRHVRDMLVYNQKRSGPCGVFRDLCQAAQQGRQFCMYDKAGSAYSCAWLVQRTAGNGSPPCVTNCNQPNPGPAPSPSTTPSPELNSPPMPDVPTDSNINPRIHPDQAILLATKNQLTGGDPDILSDWRPGSSMCDDYWEGIYCYESGPEQGAVQEITLDYGLLSGQLPAAWSNLTAPMLINLEGNHLTNTLPSSWQSLTTLATLRLAANRLSGPIPAGWSSMTGLQYLSIHNNQQLSGCMPLPFRSRKFHLYDDTGTVRSVGAGGQTTGPLNASSGVVKNTGISDWCTGS